MTAGYVEVARTLDGGYIEESEELELCFCGHGLASVWCRI